ncbi:MAG: excisionase family DNA-binding protein [Thermoguttaceae bacterium]|nr:excisionase family DNA-binding protein [Thermoguttaceae bacterium]
MTMQVSVEHLEEVLESVAKWEAQDLKTAKKLIRKFFPLERLIDKKEAAQMLNCSLRQVDYLRENYGLPWIRLGEVVRFDRAKVQEWLEAQKQTGPGCVPSLAKQPREAA